MARRVALVNNKGFATVDDADYDLVARHRWYWHPQGYAQAFINSKTVQMQRLILGSTTGFDVDHIDGNGLNNARANLRFCNASQNGGNSRLRSNNTSGFKGVSWNKSRSKWVAQIRVKYQRHFLGHFEDLVEAALAYDQAAEKYFGEFANKNFVTTGYSRNLKAASVA